MPCDFLGEETGLAQGTLAGYRWLVDPQDGTSEFLKGRRGSSVSVALLRADTVVLGVVHAPLAPDRGVDTIAWAEGAGPIRRNGAPIDVDLSRRRLERGEFVWATASSQLRPETFSRAAAPARFIAMPSIAYRLARVAAGDGAACVSVHGVNEYDIAAGMALVRAARGVALDAQGREIVLTGSVDARASGCFAGAPAAAQQLARFDWHSLEQEPKQSLRVAPQFPGRGDDLRLERAQGCLLGQLIGESLGAEVEMRSSAEIALALARSMLAQGGYDATAAFEAYRAWLQSQPFGVGATTRRGIEGRPDAESESNGSLMRVSPIGIWAAGDPARAAHAAREDSALTHPNPVCQEACAAYAAAIAAGVAGASREAMLQAALAHASKTHAASPARAAIERGAAGEAPADFTTHQDWVLVELQNAFRQLFSARSVEEALVAAVGAGGDTGTNAAIAGALLGAAHGRGAFPARWILALLACRPLPRPCAYWPDDALDLAEALVGK